MRSAPTTTAPTSPVDRKCAAAPSTITSAGMPSWDRAHAAEGGRPAHLQVADGARDLLPRIVGGPQLLFGQAVLVQDDDAAVAPEDRGQHVRVAGRALAGREGQGRHGQGVKPYASRR